MSISNEDDPVVYDSALNQIVTHDGVRLDVQIYRIDPDEWFLEVVNESNTSIVWNEPFESEQAALDEFHRTLKDEGVAAFADE